MRKNDGLRDFPDGSEYGLNPLYYETETAYVKALQKVKYACRERVSRGTRSTSTRNGLHRKRRVSKRGKSYAGNVRPGKAEIEPSSPERGGTPNGAGG